MSELLLCRVETARAVARRFGLSPDRSRSQSFLVDQVVRDAIVASLPPQPRTVLEIGCGLGALTQGLLQAGRQVVGVEVDDRAVAALGLLRARYPGLRVVAADALQVGARELGLSGPFVAVGNLPYGLTGALIPHVLGFEPPPVTCLFLVQREVAARLAAPPGGWSLSTLAVRLAAVVERRLEVGPESFWPVPKVQSTLLELRPSPVGDQALRAGLLALARPIFQQRRKQLRHGLAGALHVDPGAADELLRSVGIDPTRRPGTLELEEWLRLAPLGGVGGGEMR
ncbi:MAG: 16S rRNA (adenine(1518)-N(6)/adenine(1519)-N(6))-dimethyltransferase RsmA [Candidatus Dormiibacterota bacterium]